MSYARVSPPTPTMEHVQLTDQHSPGIASTSARSLRSTLKSLRDLFSFDKHEGAVFIHYFALFMGLSIPFAILIFNRVMHAGQPTEFPPSETRSGWTPGPTTRGSINIIWSCFSTIFTCAYVSLHLDVPVTASDIPRPGISAKLKAFWRTIVRKGGWIVFNILAPELIVQVATIEYMGARCGENRIKNPRWTLSHAFFADMGGFKIQIQSQDSSVSARENEATREHERRTSMNALVVDQDTEKGADPEYIVLQSGYDFYRWINEHGKQGEIKFKQLNLEIQGTSKADWLLKTLTCMQAAWLVVQTIARVIEGRSVSELEVTTCSYVVCALITYAFWWQKPYGVQTHLDLDVHATQGPDWKQDSNPTPFNRECDVPDVPDVPLFLGLLSILVTPLVGAVIGAIHCTLWNATFVNSNGQLLWRICCVVQICAPICSPLLTILIFKAMEAADNLPHCEGIIDYADIVPYSVGGFVYFIYFCARIVLFILIGYSFKSLPAGVYTDVDWSWSWFPHWH